MPKDDKHSEQFERYLAGNMSEDEAHAFEREVLDDPFASEALEGYQAQGLESLQDLPALRNKIQPKTRRSVPWIRIASAAVLILIGSFATYFFINQLDETEELVVDEELFEEQLYAQSPAVDTLIVQKQESVEVPPKEDSNASEGKPIESADETKGQFFAELKDQILAEADSYDEIESKIEQQPVLEEKVVAEISTNQMGEIPSEKELDFSNEAAQISQIAADVDMRSDSNVTIARSPQPIEEFANSEEAQLAEREVADEVIAEEVLEQPSERAKKRARGAVSRSASVSNTIIGTITDDSGQPLPGVNVVIKGTTTGTTSDLEGRYTIDKREGMILVFSFVGFDSQEITVGDRNTIDLSMGSAVELQEVVVTAYGGDETSATYTPAKPENGNRAYKRYLESALNYPSSALESDIEGTVTLEVTISPNGEITDIQIKKSLGFGCDEEAVRLIREGPAWVPSERNGVKEEDRVRVKVKFKLD